VRALAQLLEHLEGRPPRHPRSVTENPWVDDFLAASGPVWSRASLGQAA
jgi:hypothetical protein